MLCQLLQPRRHAGGAAPCAGAHRLVVASSLVAVFAGCGSGLDEPRHAIDPRDAPAIMPRRVDIRAEEPALPDSEVFAGADPLEPLTPPQRVLDQRSQQQGRYSRGIDPDAAGER